MLASCVMHQPIDQGGGQGVVHVEDRAPIPEGSVGSDHDRAAFAPGGDDLEQQVRTAFVDGQIAQLRTEARSPGNDERSTTRRIIAYGRGCGKETEKETVQNCALLKERKEGSGDVAEQPESDGEF